MKEMTLKSAIILAAGAMLLASCGENEVINDLDYQDQGVTETATQGTARVRLVISPSLDVTRAPGANMGVSGTRAALTANGKDLTDLYILDYDKATSKLLQVLHQTSTAADFAEPNLSLTYGDHTLKVVAMRSLSPILLDADGSLWSLADNTVFPVTASEPMVWTSDKTSDSFGAVQDITVEVGKKDQTASILLERLVAKLVVKNTGTYPADCSTMQIDLDEYKQFGWQTFDVIESVKNQRTTDLSDYAGTQGKTIAYFVLTPEEGYTTDLTFTMHRKDSSTPYATITVPDVKLERNHITTISGSYYSGQTAFSLSVADAWSEEENKVEF